MKQFFYRGELRCCGVVGRCREALSAPFVAGAVGRVILLIMGGGYGFLAPGFVGAATVTFEDLDPTIPGSGGGFYENGSNLEGGAFASGGASFFNQYDAQFDSWSGFAYSTVVDVSTPGFVNQYSAFPGSGAGGSSTYAVGFDFSAFGGLTPRIQLPDGFEASEIKIANTAYAALYMRDGVSPPFDPPSPYGGADGTEPDFFSVRVTGERGGIETGSVIFPLADFRPPGTAEDYVVDAWESVDLSPVGAADTLMFSFESSDVGAFGINTPLYVAVDDLVLRPVPEPGTAMILGFSAVVMAWIPRRRKGR